MTNENKKSALERLEQLEQQMAGVTNLEPTLNEFYKANDRRFKDLNGRLNNLYEQFKTIQYAVEAMSMLLVEKNIISLSDTERKIKQMITEEKLLIEENLIQRGLVKDALVATAESYLSLKEIDPAGVVIINRAHVDLTTIDLAQAAAFIGKSVGESVESAPNRYEIVRVLEPVTEGKKELIEETPASTENQAQ